MPKPRTHNRAAISFLLLLLFFTLLAENSLVFGSTVSDSERVIAKRPDPLRNFKKYGGGYDISNKHYWASAVFTGIHGYAAAGVWLLSGIGFGSYIVLRNFSSGSSSQMVDHPNSSYMIMFCLIVLLIVFAIIATGIILAANQKSFQRTKRLEGIIFGAGFDVCGEIGKVKITLVKMQTLLQEYDSKISAALNTTAHELRKDSQSVQQFVVKTRKTFDQAIQALYVVNLVIISVNLASLVSGLVLLVLHYRPGILVLIFSWWILTTLTWILTGVDFFFHIFIGDTCSTLNEFKANPQNNSLAEMLPCPKITTSTTTMTQIGSTIHSFIEEINSKMSELRQTLLKNEQIEDTLIRDICDPFSSAPNYTYSPENCGKNSFSVGDLPSVISRFVCFSENSSETCRTDGRFVPEATYSIIMAYSLSLQDMIDIYPDVSGLLQCSSVKEAISDIVEYQCRPIKQSTKVLWSSLLALSLVMVILVLVWCEKAIIQDRGKCFSKWSIFPKPIRMRS